jgi:hypothetical protein
MKMRFFLIAPAVALVLPVAALADQQTPCSRGQEPVTVSVAGSSSDNDRGTTWTSSSLDVRLPSGWCDGEIAVGLSRDSRRSGSSTLFNAGLSGAFQTGAVWEVTGRIGLENADFAARHGVSASLGVPMRFDTGPIGGMVISATGSHAAYQDADLNGVGLTAELYPRGTPGWITLSTMQYARDRDGLPVAYRARIDWPVNDSLRVFAWGGLGYEDTGNALEEVRPALVGLRQDFGGSYHWQLSYGREDRSISGDFDSFGMSLGRSF